MSRMSEITPRFEGDHARDELASWRHFSQDKANSEIEAGSTASTSELSAPSSPQSVCSNEFHQLFAAAFSFNFPIAA